MKPNYLRTLLALTCFASPALAKKTHSNRTVADSPEKQLAGFTVPDGFVVELVASEKDGIINPIDLTFDDAGRLWTQTARMYPIDPVKNIPWNQLLRLMDNPAEQDKNPEFKRIKDLYQGKTKGSDEVLVLSNIYGKGVTKVDKFATGLTIPQSILPYKNGVYVMQGSEFFYLEDTDNDGKSDKRTPVLTGFGFTDTHTMGHTLVRAPGGWINFSQGALNKGKITAVKSGNSTRIDFSKIARVSIDGNKIELVNAGLNNIWGFQLRSNGQWFLTEANDHGQSIVPAEPYTAFKGIGNQKLRSYQTFFPPPHKFRVGGTGISGLAFNDDLSGKWAEEYKDVAFLANPITSTINNVRIERNADGTVKAKHLTDFLTSKDDWFRPVNIEFGPDGNLYIADFYNKIVSHNEVATSHPDRDKAHGRIWRVRPKTAKERNVPDLTKANNQALIGHLKSSFFWEAKGAWQQIADRQAKELAPALGEILTDSSAPTSTRIMALWSLESLGAFDKTMFITLLKDSDANIRREVLRSLVTFQVEPDMLAEFLMQIKQEPNVMVRSQAIRTIENLGKANNQTIDIAVSFCHPAASNNELGKGYEINFERYLARRALEKYPKELTSYLQTTLASKQPSANIIWARQALGSQTTQSILKQWETLKKQPLKKETLILIAGLQKNAEIDKAIYPYFADAKNATHIAKLALEHIEDAYTPAVGHPLAETSMTLVKSSNPEDIILGLKLAQAYRITHLSKNFANLLPETKDANVKLEIVNTLAYLPKPFTAQFKTVMNDSSNSLALRIAALSGYTQASGNNAIADVKAFLKNDASRAALVIDTLGNTTQGSALLVKLVAENAIKADAISDTIAERIHHFSPKDATAKAIYKMSTDRKAVAHANAKTRIPKLMKFIENNPGNLTTGKGIFTGMCLSCHVVGEEGAAIGPALDGSKHRDLNHLLTAVLLPDEAAENAYILFRTTETSGHITEGLKLKQTKRGTSIGHQGGRITFIPARTIQKQAHVGSQSFMPSGQFDKLTDNVLADIISYMKTL